MPEEITQTSTELDDSSANTRTNTERDAVTTDLSQDVDTQERIRTNAVSYDHTKQQAEVENQRRDRQQYDSMFNQTLQFQQQMQAVVLQGMQNMVNANNMAQNQDRRHVDHTLTDLHGSDVNPGAGPGAPTTAE